MTPQQTARIFIRFPRFSFPALIIKLPEIRPRIAKIIGNIPSAIREGIIPKIVYSLILF